MDLEEKVVVIAGGSGVLGGAIARELAANGSTLLLAGRDQEKLNRLAEEVGAATTVEFDIRSPGSAGAPIEAAVDQFGRVDGLINATGVVAFGPIDNYPEEVIDEMISTNLLGPLHMMTLASSHVTSFFVNISGVIAEQPFPNMGPYVASKTGLSAFSRALGRELRKKKVLVLDARPPHTETGLSKRAIFGQAPRMPDGLEPDHVARVIVEGIVEEKRELPSEAFEPS